MRRKASKAPQKKKEREMGNEKEKIPQDLEKVFSDAL